MCRNDFPTVVGRHQKPYMFDAIVQCSQCHNRIRLSRVVVAHTPRMGVSLLQRSVRTYLRSRGHCCMCIPHATNVHIHEVWEGPKHLRGRCCVFLSHVSNVHISEVWESVMSSHSDY